MGFKENYRKLGIYLQVEEKLKNKNFELEEINKKISVKKSELEEIDEKISVKKSELEEIDEKISSKKLELELLKNEVIELNDFINKKFKEDFKKCDYEVDIANCYIIGLHGKKYIALRKCNSVRSEWYTMATGHFNVKIYTYYDVLNIDDSKYKYLCGYKYCYDDKNVFPPKIEGHKPEYEKHILEVYPELSAFYDNQVPNTYLKKIYYEINDLGNKKLLKL